MVSKCNAAATAVQEIYRRQAGDAFLYPRNDVPIVPWPMSGKMRNESSGSQGLPRVNSGRRRLIGDWNATRAVHRKRYSNFQTRCFLLAFMRLALRS